MTDQRKIPLPQRPDEQTEGKSLFERASGAFGLESPAGGFKPAAVPNELNIPAALRRKPAAKPQTPPGDPVAAPAPAQVEQPVATAPAPEAPAAPAEPVRFGGPVHSVDRATLQDQGLIAPEGGVTALLEEFRIVKRQVLNAARSAVTQGGGAAAQRVLVCSPLPGEGKSFCAVNLALAMAAEKDSEVLLVDADFAKPSVLAMLGITARGAGLMDALADSAIAVEDCVLRTDIRGLSVLPAGNRTAQDSEYLAARHAGEVLDRLTQGAPNRIVIFDSPPALAASPAAELAKYVGQAVLVVRADQTGQSAIEDALSLLSACGDIKLLLNAASFSPSGRKFGSYYGYGEQS